LPRLFGSVDREDIKRRDDVPSALSGNLSAEAGKGAETEISAEGRVTIGLVRDQQPFQGEVIDSDKHGCSVAYTGFIPSDRELYSRYEVGPDAGTAELILNMYLKEGEGFLREVPGMFSVAIHDRNRDRLLIAGDRSGAFPLYYYSEEGKFIFASSVNAVREACGRSRLRTASVVEHLLFDALYGRYTFYEDIFITEFGGYLCVDTGSGAVRRGRYFSYEELFDIDLYRSRRNIKGPEELTARARSCLGRITGGRDPEQFGLSCGGGIDCSYLGGVLNDIGFSMPVLCTSVSDARLQEDSMARDTAERLGVDLHTSYLNSEDFYPFLMRSILDFGQPIVHPSTPKSYAGTPDGEGRKRPHHIMGVSSDLLFGGYGNVKSFYKYVKIRALFDLLPRKLSTLLRIGSEDLEKIKLQLRMRNSLRDIGALGMGNMERGADQARIEQALSSIPDRRERDVKKLMLQNLFDYQQHLLNRRYEISARCGVSLYYPFLDLEMIRFAVNLPVSHCVSWKQSKIIVRKAALPYLGEGLATRAKYGGDVPIEKWIIPMKWLLEDGFVAEVLGYDPRRLSNVSGKNMKILWNMIDIELWGRLCLRGEDPDKILDKIRDGGIRCSSFEKIIENP